MVGHCRFPTLINLMVYRVMRPLLFDDPSTLSTGIGLASGNVGIRCLITNLESMNCPSAPESISADNSVLVPFARSVIGIRIVFPLGFPTIIFETFSVWGGECAVSLPLNENPSLKYQLD